MIFLNNYKLNYSKQIILVLVLLFLLIIPSFTFALEYWPIIRCGIGSTTDDVKSNDAVGKGCDFKDFIDTINRIINWIISIAGVIFTISAIYGGFLYMTSGTSLGDKEKAKNILWSTIIGFVIILCAWLIVYTLLTYLVPKGTGDDSVFKFLGGR